MQMLQLEIISFLVSEVNVVCHLQIQVSEETHVKTTVHQNTTFLLVL